MTSKYCCTSRAIAQTVAYSCLVAFISLNPSALLAQGLPDCNQNGIPDICDIAPETAPEICASVCTPLPGEESPCGQSEDCNLNGVPDECDTDLAQSQPADRCRDAEQIAPGLVYTGTTVGANPENTATSCDSPGSPGSSDVYYLYTPSIDGTLEATLCGSEFDTLISIHTRCPASSSNELVCNDDSDDCTEAPNTSAASIPVQGGKKYYIRIGGSRPHESGNFTLMITGPGSGEGRNDCDDDGIPDECETDSDQDGIPDDCDNCPNDANEEQEDADNDGIGDICDFCPDDPDNDADGDGVCGDVDICEGYDDSVDTDSDGIPDGCDICAGHDDNIDTDSDGIPDGCDICPGHDDNIDTDSDGIPDGCDICPNDPDNDADDDGVCGNVDICEGFDDNVDTDSDGIPDGCDICPNDPDNDADDDGVCGDVDNCPANANPGQEDADGDGIGDACDPCPNDADNDADDDGVCGNVDNCPTNANPGQEDADGDGIGDACDPCPNDADNDADDDGVCGNVDNCPANANPGQEDADGDGIGDECDICPNDADNDADGDGVCGDLDICQGEDDTIDSDQDETPDCLDQCPDDPDKTEPGECGCGVSDVDENENGIPDCNDETNDRCDDDEECIFEELEPTACAGANGFLKQINVASVINLQATPLKATVSYTNLNGELRGSVTTTLEANLKLDFIINDLGLEPDSYGTVCVATDAAEAGAWSGGVTIYKPDERSGEPAPFGTAFDFALYHPFTNPRIGQYTQPLNTFHLGVDPVSTVANWVSITDGTPGDGNLLTGKLVFFDEDGNTTEARNIWIPDSGRFDFSGHEGIGGTENRDAVGMVRFLPDALPDGTPAKYYIVVARYFYECEGASCPHFHTAFVVPQRPAATVALSGGVSTVGGLLSVVELNNTVGQNEMLSTVSIYSQSGNLARETEIVIPPLGTRHLIVNQAANSEGGLADDSVGSAEATPAGEDAISALSVFYKLDEAGTLLYAYASPMIQSPGAAQISEFNTFIGHKNEGEVYNPNNVEVKVDVQGLDYQDESVFNSQIVLAPKSTERFEMALPSDSYGTIIIQSSEPSGVVFRNHVIKENEYVLPFGGR